MNWLRPDTWFRGRKKADTKPTYVSPAEVISASNDQLSQPYSFSALPAPVREFIKKNREKGTRVMQRIEDHMIVITEDGKVYYDQRLVRFDLSADSSVV